MFKETGECPKRCRRWDECPGKDYYEQKEICYCRNQVRWLILEFLRVKGNEVYQVRDTWPRKESGYTEAAPTVIIINRDLAIGKIMSHNYRTVSSHAPFESVAMIIGELRARLAITGKDGRLLALELYQEGGLSDDARWALGFVSGFTRKNKLYTVWQADKKWREKIKLSFLKIVKT